MLEGCCLSLASFAASLGPGEKSILLVETETSSSLGETEEDLITLVLGFLMFLMMVFGTFALLGLSSAQDEEAPASSATNPTML